MLLSTIALIVLCAAIFVMFNEELQSFAKKLYESKKVRLLAPLFIASFMVLYFEVELYKCLIAMRIFAFSVIYYFSKLVHIPLGILILEKTLFLSLIAFIPIILAKLLEKVSFFSNYNIVYLSKNANVFLWVIFAVLIVVSL